MKREPMPWREVFREPWWFWAIEIASLLTLAIMGIALYS